MHKTYSLRNQRAPTASQLQSPQPPKSTTRGKFFGKGGIAYNLRKNTAGAMGPELARKLSQLVKIEKNVLRSMEIASIERRQAATSLSVWGLENDDDVSDITDKLGVLIYEVSELDEQFIDRYDQYRLTLKSIRDIENSIEPSRIKKDKVMDKISFLKYKEPDNYSKIEILEQELVRCEAECLVAEAQLSNITRAKLKAAFTYQFDSIIEHSEKIALIAGYGQALLQLLDDAPVTPGETRPAYDGYEASKQILIDAEHALTEWTLDYAQVKTNYSMRNENNNYIDENDEYINEDDEEIEYLDTGNTNNNQQDFSSNDILNSNNRDNIINKNTNNGISNQESANWNNDSAQNEQSL